jgi:hypothetical protein
MQDISGSDGTVGQRRAGPDEVSILNQDVLRQSDEILTSLFIFSGNDHLAITPLDFPEGNHPINFCYSSRVGWVTSFKQLCYPGQTTGNILDLT